MSSGCCCCAGCQLEFSASEDVHSVASLLKLYLRELPEPLVPFVCYPHFQSAVKSKLTALDWCVVLTVSRFPELAGGMDVAVESLQRALLHLPKTNVNVMKYVV